MIRGNLLPCLALVAVSATNARRGEGSALAWVFILGTRAFFLAIGGTLMVPKTGKLKVGFALEPNGLGGGCSIGFDETSCSPWGLLLDR